MRKLFLLTILTILCIGCEKDEWDLNNPEVEKFVQQLKNETYDYYEKGENGEDLWLIMPNFVKHHIQSLIDFSIDTSHINDFPVNPTLIENPKGLKGYQLLVVRSYYKDWWSNFNDKDWKEKNPLEGSPYRWF
jgi:hypothetical protein